MLHKKKSLILFIVIALILALTVFFVFISFGKKGQKKSTISDSSVSQSFDEFTDTIFFQQLAGDSLSRHFYIADTKSFLKNYIESKSTLYSDYSIDLSEFSNAPETFGSLSYDELKESQSYYVSQIRALQQFNYSGLTPSQQQAYDIMLHHYRTNLDFGDLCLCYEILNPTTGFQSQLPVLLSEYQFNNKKAVDNYLALLSTLPSYFNQLITFENTKYENRHFMDSDICREIIAQCNSFIGTKSAKDCLLTKTFNTKIENCSFLTNQDTADYKAKNIDAITRFVIPAYENLINGLTKLVDLSPDAHPTLASFPDGADYYEYLVKSYTGSSKSVPEIQSMIQRKISSDMTEISDIIAKHPEIENQFNKYAANPSENPEEILSDLKKHLNETVTVSDSLPAYSIKYVDSSLEDFLSPAFFLTPAIDSPQKNVIYINKSTRFQNQDLYTTLAHEGFPGHMYQYYVFTDTNPSLIRYLLNFGGYTEGWATYVEFFSYQYCSAKNPDAKTMSSNLATVLSDNASFSLGIYSLVDIGVNHDGWSLKDTSDFLNNYGLSSPDSCQEIYDAVRESPANYLQYYVGYLEILELRDYYLSVYENASLQDFHKYFLEFGPAPFDVLKKYVVNN